MPRDVCQEALPRFQAVWYLDIKLLLAEHARASRRRRRRRQRDAQYGGCTEESCQYDDCAAAESATLGAARCTCYAAGKEPLSVRINVVQGGGEGRRRDRGVDPMEGGKSREEAGRKRGKKEGPREGMRHREKRLVSFELPPSLPPSLPHSPYSPLSCTAQGSSSLFKKTCLVRGSMGENAGIGAIKASVPEASIPQRRQLHAALLSVVLQHPIQPAGTRFGSSGTASQTDSKL